MAFSCACFGARLPRDRKGCVFDDKIIPEIYWWLFASMAKENADVERNIFSIDNVALMFCMQRIIVSSHKGIKLIGGQSNGHAALISRFRFWRQALSLQYARRESQPSCLQACVQIL